MIWIRKHPLKVFFLALFCFGIVLPASLNYSGMCIPKGRWLSDKEKIRAVVDVANFYSVAIIEKKRYDKKGNIQIKSIPYKRIPYNNPDDVIRLNPGCCQIGSRNFGDGLWQPPSPILNRLSGYYADIVSLKFKDYYIDEYENKKPYIAKWYFVISNCGMVWSN